MPMTARRNEPGAISAGLGREQADVKAQHRIEAELSGHDHGHGHGSFTERIREPAVQRKDRHLDRKGQQKRERNPVECPGREVAVR